MLSKLASMIWLFFDVGGGEIMLIALVVLLFFGGKRLPELMKGLGKGIREFNTASNGRLPMGYIIDFAYCHFWWQRAQFTV